MSVVLKSEFDFGSGSEVRRSYSAEARSLGVVCAWSAEALGGEEIIEERGRGKKQRTVIQTGSITFLNKGIIEEAGVPLEETYHWSTRC